MSMFGGVLAVGAMPLIARDAIIRARWRRAAKKLGLEFRPGPMTGSDLLFGDVRGFSLFVDNVRRQKTMFTLAAPNRIHGEIYLKRALLFGAWEKSEALMTGDREFDRNFVLRGPREVVIPLLDKRTRDTIAGVLERRDVEVQGSRVTYTAGQVIQSPVTLQECVADLTWVASALELAMPCSDKLRLNATSRDEPLRFRIANLEILLERYPGSARANVACRAALASKDVEERLIAAIGLGADGEAVDAVTGIALAEAIPAPHRIRALSHLAGIVADDRIASVVDSVVVSCASSAVPEVKAHALHIAVERGLGSARELLLRALEMVYGDAAPLITAAEGIRRLASEAPEIRAETEDALIRLLASEETSVRIAAAAALRDVGSLRAVEPLIPFTKGLLVDLDLKRTAREAIRSIQSRLPDAESGLLSVLGPPEKSGGLSIADPKDGELSFPTARRKTR